MFGKLRSYGYRNVEPFTRTEPSPEARTQLAQGLFADDVERLAAQLRTAERQRRRLLHRLVVEEELPVRGDAKQSELASQVFAKHRGSNELGVLLVHELVRHGDVDREPLLRHHVDAALEDVLCLDQLQMRPTAAKERVEGVFEVLPDLLERHLQTQQHHAEAQAGARGEIEPGMRRY